MATIESFQVRPETSIEREKFIMAAFECGYNPSVYPAILRGDKYQELVKKMPWFGFPINLATGDIKKIQPFSEEYGIDHIDSYPLMTVEDAIEYMVSNRISEEVK